MVLTKLPLMAMMANSGVTKLDDVNGGVGSEEEPIYVEFVAERTVLIKRIVLSNHDNAASFNMNKFAGETLAKGFKVVKVYSSGSEGSLIGETAMKNYSDFVEKGFKIERDIADADWYQLVLDFQEACGTYIKLREGEKIRVYAQDDISAISHVEFAVLGFIG